MELQEEGRERRMSVFLRSWLDQEDSKVDPDTGEMLKLLGRSLQPIDHSAKVRRISKQHMEPFKSFCRAVIF
jgi:hypothetical protein